MNKLDEIALRVGMDLFGRERPADVKYARALLADPELLAELSKDADAEFVMVSKECFDRFPEINRSNYDHNDVCALNAWGVELVLSAHLANTAELGKDAVPVAYLYQGINGGDLHNQRVIARTEQECGRNQYPDTWKEIGPLFTRQIPANAAEIEQRVAEACRKAVLSEHLEAPTSEADDIAYDNAIDDAAVAIRKWREYK